MSECERYLLQDGVQWECLENVWFIRGESSMIGGRGLLLVHMRSIRDFEELFQNPVLWEFRKGGKVFMANSACDTSSKYQRITNDVPDTSSESRCTLYDVCGTSYESQRSPTAHIRSLTRGSLNIP